MTNKLTILFLILALVLVRPVKALAAPHYTLTPLTGGSYSIGSTFVVTLGVATGTEEMVLGDIEGRFNSSLLELVTIQKITPVTERAFPYDENVTLTPNNTAGSYGITLSDPDHPSLLEGTVANGNLFKLIFRAKASGTAAVTFECSAGSTIDSNILIGKDALDKIACTENSVGSYIIAAGAAGAGTTTATTTTTRATTTTAAARTLPQTGVTGATVAMMIVGTIGMIGAFLLKFL